MVKVTMCVKENTKSSQSFNVLSDKTIQFSNMKMAKIFIDRVNQTKTYGSYTIVSKPVIYS